MKILLRKDDAILEGVLFNVDDRKAYSLAEEKNVIYCLNLNPWMEKVYVQLIIKDIFQKN